MAVSKVKKNDKNLLDLVVSSIQEDTLDNSLEQIVVDAFSDILPLIKDEELKKFISSIFYLSEINSYHRGKK